MYYIYMLRCCDNSLYTGITTNLNRRMQEHFSKGEKCSKYTFYHTAKKLETAWETSNRSLASKLEYHIKRLSKMQKESLIQNKSLLSSILENKIDSSDYSPTNIKEIIKEH